MIREVLAPYVVDDDPLAPPNFSLQLHERGDDGRNRLHHLFSGHTMLIRSLSPGRVVRALVAHLDELHHVRAPGPELRLRQLVLVRDGGVLLLPSSARGHIVVKERRFQRAGIAVLDAPFAHVDLDTAELVVRPPELEARLAPLDAADAPFPEHPRAEPSVVPGRYRITGWIFPGQQPPAPVTRAQAVFHAARDAVDLRTRDAATTLADLGAVFDAVERRSEPLDHRVIWDRAAELLP